MEKTTVQNSEFLKSFFHSLRETLGEQRTNPEDLLAFEAFAIFDYGVIQGKLEKIEYFLSEVERIIIEANSSKDFCGYMHGRPIRLKYNIAFILNNIQQIMLCNVGAYTDLYVNSISTYASIQAI